MPAKCARHDLKLSSIGIGTYLGNADEATDLSYTRAIVRAVQLGVNVIDTAVNYRFQRSERSIGEALKILANEHGIAREDLFICTKGGYLLFDGAPGTYYTANGDRVYSLDAGNHHGADRNEPRRTCGGKLSHGSSRMNTDKK